MLASSSSKMSPFLQLRIVLRPTNAPRLIEMPWFVVPFASRQHWSSMTTLSSISILCGCRRMMLHPNATFFPTRPRINGYNFERRNRPSAPGTQDDSRSTVS